MGVPLTVDLARRALCQPLPSRYCPESSLLLSALCRIDLQAHALQDGGRPALPTQAYSSPDWTPSCRAQLQLPRRREESIEQP